MFTVLNAVILRTLPAADPQQLFVRHELGWTLYDGAGEVLSVLEDPSSATTTDSPHLRSVVSSTRRETASSSAIRMSMMIGAPGACPRPVSRRDGFGHLQD